MSIEVGNEKLPVDETSTIFCNLVTLKGELVEKSITYP
jgi:hypothetical protein